MARTRTLVRRRRRVDLDVVIGVPFLLGFAVWLVGHVVEDVAETRALRARGTVATGTVVEVDRRVGRFADSSVVVEFAAGDGRPVRARVVRYYWDPEPTVGSVARLRYDPDAPSRHVVDDRIGPDPLGPWLEGALALGCVVGAGLVALTARD